MNQSYSENNKMEAVAGTKVLNNARMISEARQ